MGKSTIQIHVFFTLFCILIIVSTHIHVKAQGQTTNHTFVSGGISRDYILHTPDGIDSNAPLLFCVHGYTGSAQGIMNSSGFNQIANENKFVVCYPQGLVDSYGSTFWQVGYTFHSNEVNDDLAFLKELAQYLQNEYGLSAANTFCTGMSNGGDVCNMLACKAPEIFKAVAPICGCMMKWIKDECSSSTTIPIMMMNGTADGTTWWDGDINDNQGYGAYLGVEANRDFWTEKNQVSHTSTETLPNINTGDGSTVELQKYTSDISGNEVWLYKIINGGHDWPGAYGNMDINASEVAWDFLSRYITITTSNNNYANNEMFNIYPNPTSNYINIANSRMINVLDLLDITGNIILSRNNVKRLHLDIQNIATGLYFLRIKSGLETTINKIVIE